MGIIINTIECNLDGSSQDIINLYVEAIIQKSFTIIEISEKLSDLMSD